MPIIKIYPSKRPVRGILQYITRGDTVPEELIRTNGCDILDAEQEFSDIARYYNKPTGVRNRTYYHMIVSYNTTYEKISPEEVRDMVKDLCQRTKIDCYQWYLAVHTDRPDHMHAHVVINNVSYRGDRKQHVKAGKSFQSTGKLRHELMEKGNVICKEHGYELSLVNTKSKAQERLTRAELALAAKGEISWKDKLRNQIEYAKEQASSSSEFIWLMKDNFGVTVQEHKNAYRYIPEFFTRKNAASPKPCHERRLGGDYTKETIVNYIERKAKHYDNYKKEKSLVRGDLAKADERTVSRTYEQDDSRER